MKLARRPVSSLVVDLTQSMPRKKLDDALNRLAAQEDNFLSAEFLAPVVRGGGGRVGVRIANVVCDIRITPRDFEGFGVFKPESHVSARLARPATMSERRKYLELFPRVSLVIRSRTNESTTAAAVGSNAADARFSAGSETEVRLVEQEVELFDTVMARFDGRHFWFDQLDPRADPSTAPFLRQALVNMIDPALVDQRPALSPGQRLAYLLNYRARVETALAAERAKRLDERTTNEKRLREALEHAGARLRDFVEQHDGYRVTYDVDGQRHVSIVQKNNLTVQTAGICLSGQDSDFDLASLVGVLRESRHVF
jgi:hypothetical protein